MLTVTVSGLGGVHEDRRHLCRDQPRPEEVVQGHRPVQPER
jgi:hypothetical protein